jgi:segregation and condensation protein A
MDGKAADTLLSDQAEDNPADPGPWAAGAGEGASLRLVLDGFTGPLELLLNLARGHQIDLARLSLPALVDQLTAALRQAAPLARKGDWVVTAAWLLQLRSHLLLPTDAPSLLAAEAEADRLRDRLVGLREVQALAGWLDRRNQLGHDVFARGQPELLGTSTTPDYEVDVIEFLWASLALFEDGSEAADTRVVYRPAWHDLHSIADARTRILRLLADTPEGYTLGRLLPEVPAGDASTTATAVRRRSAWTSIFVASLELARQSEVTLAQEGAFTAIHVSPAPVATEPAP